MKKLLKLKVKKENPTAKDKQIVGLKITIEPKV